jgi:hypothetical protein
MATTIKSTELDFNAIKSRLKDYLKAKDEFSDYNFEASGISNILDVLAYNTHFNGLTANFALNESFLNTAQLRSSVVSHAEALGYVPRSYTSPKALLNISVSINVANRPTVLSLAKNTLFTTSIDNVSYTFRTLEQYSATDDGNGLYQFLTKTGSDEIPIYEGTLKSKTFFVGETEEEQIYVLNDVTMDTATLDVKVYDTSSGSSYTSYTNLRDAIKIDATSTHFQIKEVPNGSYELLFGDGVTTGKKPAAGNKIVVEYLSTAATDANGGTTFSASSDITVNGVEYTLGISTASESAGGAYKESIDSIRRNAPIGFASQQRLVTAEDYRAQILARYNNYVTDVVAWGGMDNDPPKYGAVYVSLNFKDGVSTEIQQDVKDEIVKDLTSNISIMSIDTLFTDAVTTFLELNTFFNLDPDLTNSTPRAVEADIDELINNYFTTNLKSFSKVFRRSALLTEVDAFDEAILNSRMDVKMQQRFTPSLGQSLSYTVKFPTTIANPDDEFYRITSNRFVFDGVACTIRNKLNSNKLEIVDIDGQIKVDNVGSYTAETGTVSLVGFRPTSIEGGTEIKISVVPTNQGTIRPLRNYVLNIDDELSITSAQIDYQETRVTL